MKYVIYKSEIWLYWFEYSNKFEASKWVNFNYILCEVNLFRPGGLQKVEKLPKVDHSWYKVCNFWHTSTKWHTQHKVPIEY